MSLRCHFDVTSISLVFHFDFTLISLGFHFDVTLISFRFHFDFTSISLRFHFDVTSISLRFHFNLTLASLKTLANHSENEAGGTTATGGSAAPREPAKTHKSIEKQRTASLYPSKPMQETPGKLHHLAEQLFI